MLDIVLVAVEMRGNKMEERAEAGKEYKDCGFYKVEEI